MPGKDIVAFNLMVRAALQRIGIYYYILPTAVQARRVLFEGFTSEGSRILDFIPEQLIAKINVQQMKVELINGSHIIFLGSDRFDSLRGSNPVGVVMSEAAYQHPSVYPTIRPILAANGGWVLLISTPDQTNHFYSLFEVAKKSEDWFHYYLTVNETGHISQEEIQREIDSGEISYPMAQQEYYCSFTSTSIGSWYGSYLSNMYLNNQIAKVDWEPNLPVHSAWDLGIRDFCSILMFQVVGRNIHIIDMYQKSDVGLEHYIKVLQSYDYIWGKHIAPHDIEVREFTSGLSRKDKAAQLGFKFSVAPKLPIIDGIEAVRTTLPRIYINEERCKPLIDALRNYSKEYNYKTDTYSSKPTHDKHSHVADALRYLCTSLKFTQQGMTADDIKQLRYQALYGTESTMPKFFQD